MRRDLIALPDASKVWIYQANQHVSSAVAREIKSYLYDFSMQWTSHGEVVQSYAQLFHNIFIVFVADESNHVSGCSIDSSVRLVKQIELKYKLDFFDRLQLSYLKDGKVNFIHSLNVRDAYNDNLIDDRTLMFDNLVNTKEGFINKWIVPLGESWHRKFVK